MRRRMILGFAIGLAICAGVLPLFAIGYISHQRAVEAERTHLTEYAGWTLRRGNLTLTEAQGALKKLQSEGYAGCTPAHIARMRQLAVEERFVEEIGYFENGRLACTGWGMVHEHSDKGVPDVSLPGGFGLYLNVDPVVSKAGRMLAVSYGDYNALIKPERMVDVLTSSQMVLGVATRQGQMIAMSGEADPVLVRHLARNDAAGMTDAQIYASADSQDLRAFAISPRTALQGHLDRERWLLIPLALCVSLVLVGVIVWVSRERLSPQKELAAAIRKRAFVVHYQPIIELESGQCVGAEALLRWRKRDGTWVAPDVFIPLAEAHDLIEDLTDLMIERVCHDLPRIGDGSLRVTLNISACDMESGRFLPVLGRAIERAGLAPSQVWLEATERGFMNADAARRTIDAARAAGHRVAIDDFGTGYSSLSLLETLPLDALKIDKSFVQAIGRNSATSVVLPHIVDMAHGLKLGIVAEGVETVAQEAYIRSMGIEFAQGWLYSRALPAEGFDAFRRAHNAAQAVTRLREVA